MKFPAGFVVLVLALMSAVTCRGEGGIVVPQGTKTPRVLFTAGRRNKEVRLREGTKLVDVVGRIQLSGERVSFVPLDSPEGTSYRVLENLALERVLDHLNESRIERLWIVSGVVTEFRSANHLLITKAVIQAQETTEAAP